MRRHDNRSSGSCRSFAENMGKFVELMLLGGIGREKLKISGKRLSNHILGRRHWLDPKVEIRRATFRDQGRVAIDGRGGCDGMATLIRPKSIPCCDPEHLLSCKSGCKCCRKA